MLRRFWAPTNAPQGSLASYSPDIREARLLNVTKALELVMNDDLDDARLVLEKYDDAFHTAGLAIKSFVESSVSLEKADVMICKGMLEHALASCEVELSYAIALPHSKFPDGAEFQVIIGQLQLCLAIAGLLSESIPEAMKAIWKMKRSYKIFYDLNKHMVDNKMNTTSKFESIPLNGPAGVTSSLKRITTPQLEMAAGSQSDSCPTDYFTACASASGYGILSLIISIAPPAISRLLSVIGFRGDKEQALADLWSVAKAPNIMGGLGLLGLVTYHGLLTATCDILDDDERQSERLAALLDSTMSRYPSSAIWKLNKARMEQQRGHLHIGINTLESFQANPQLRQIEALKLYDLGFAYVNTLQWQKAADSFILVASKNDWSQAFYHYLIGCCFVELQRDSNQKLHADQALNHFTIASKQTGKKKIMGKEFPLEVYLKRKLRKWKGRSTSTTMLDGISVSPIMEICHIFNLWKKMDLNLWEHSLRLVQRNGPWPDSKDDTLTRQLMICSLRRHLKDWEAIEVLTSASKTVRQDFKIIPEAEIWAVPYTYYEHAAFLWARDGMEGASNIRMWIEKAKAFGESEFGQRLSIRLNTALQTLDMREH